MGACFPSEWFGVPNPLRRGGSERLVAEPPKMTLLLMIIYRIYKAHFTNMIICAVSKRKTRKENIETS